MRLALLTLENRANYVIDDDLAIAELRRRGHAVEEVPWRRPTDWRTFDAVVIRTTWDYQRDLDAFLAALERIVAAGVPLANALPLVKWNARKTYLKDLAARGVAVVPSVWGEGLTSAELRALPQRLASRECVLKPVVSANAEDTYRVHAGLDDATVARICARFEGRAWLAQPFVGSIVRDGELSLFHFLGVYSHAVRKTPAAGDFRVQEEYGGHIAPLEPDATLRAVSDRVLATLEGPAPLQARVDLVRLDDGSVAVMELEAIEPSLYFRTHPDAAAHFADAVERWRAPLPR